MHFSAPALLILSSFFASSLSFPILPTADHIVKHGWPNGPSTSAKLGGGWPTFGEGSGVPLILRHAQGHCVTSSLTIAQVYDYNAAAKFQLRETDNAIVSENKQLCKVSTANAVSLSPSCGDAWTFLSNGSVQHQESGLCLTPSDTSSAFGRDDTTDLILSSSCAGEWKFEFWDEPLQPPGFKNGFTLSGSASSQAMSGSTPRFSVVIKNEDGVSEGFRETLSGPDGTIYNVQAIRSSDGQVFQHVLNSIEHIAWGVRMFIRPHAASGDGEYEDITSDWNAFFSNGDVITFQKDASGGGSECTPTDTARYTGYDSGGSFCVKTSGALDENPHVVIYSGKIGTVLDLSGGSLVKQIGSTESIAEPKILAQVYANLPSASLDITAELSCNGNAAETFALSSSSAQLGLVRAGHTVTQVTATNLNWLSVSSELVLIASSTYVLILTPTRPSGLNNPCPETYPTCVGFVSGSSWGKCELQCSDDQFWLEVDVWPDSVGFLLKGVGGFDTCTGTVTVGLNDGDGNSIATGSGDVGNLEVGLRFENDGAGGIGVKDAAGSSVTVTSSNGGVLYQPQSGDWMVEVPSSAPRCSYTDCGDKFFKVPVTLSNAGDEEQSVRVVLSRRFPIRAGSLSQPSGPGAEITGLSIMLLDENGMPSGIPVQISKNWHSGSDAAYWAGFDGSWWSGNAFFVLPGNSGDVELTFALSYEKFGGVSAWSHAQLSIVGYSDRWLWEESALGTGGENICFDPLGSHTRAPVTDIRVKLFDRAWKKNVGGADFSLLYFDESGAMVYPKELDPMIWSNGPCLSNASYFSVSDDAKMKSEVEVSGARTDDFVRVFFRIRHEAVTNVGFSRLSFFQLASENYNYNNLFTEYVFGSGETKGEVVTRSCGGGTSKASSNMYYDGGIYRQEMQGEGPWWISMGGNVNDVAYADNKMVVGDRGLVVRKFSGRMGGVDIDTPSVSVLCDKIEFGPDASVTELSAGDFWEAEFELLVLPREEDYETARTNSGSSTLERLVDMSPWERVRAQATGGELGVSAGEGVVVESHYPIRVKGGSEGQVRFDTTAISPSCGYVPIVIGGLETHALSDGVGLWWKPQADEGGAGTWTQANSQATLGETSNYYQVNWVRETGTYEIVFNVEVVEPMSFNFGSDPGTWTVSPTVSPTTSAPTTSSPTSAPTTLTPTSPPTTLMPTSLPTISTSSPTSSPTISTSSPTSSPTPPLSPCTYNKCCHPTSCVKREAYTGEDCTLMACTEIWMEGTVTKCELEENKCVGYTPVNDGILVPVSTSGEITAVFEASISIPNLPELPEEVEKLEKIVEVLAAVIKSAIGGGGSTIVVIISIGGWRLVGEEVGGWGDGEIVFEVTKVIGCEESNCLDVSENDAEEIVQGNIDSSLGSDCRAKCFDELLKNEVETGDLGVEESNWLNEVEEADKEVGEINAKEVSSPRGALLA
ncbi:hypothetical protein TL16_g06263 [Triparma laevis f. inornata]|uniref:Uncharacterized protein n=1 Tax=Triparma laevis f. inornata TaxID=1714386 RepID=A0A9W7ECC9_9STRA|nr:hypothetical protein TL16_g06263 [Triparma laevis f. inornata]